MRKHWVMLVAACLVPSWEGAASTLTRGEFTALFEQEAETVLADTGFDIVDELHLRANKPGGGELIVFLDNAYHSYELGQQPLYEAIQSKIVVVDAQLNHDSHQQVSRILPVIKPQSFLVRTREQLSEAGVNKDLTPFYYEHLNSDLIVLYVLDTPQSAQYLTKAQVKALGLSATHLRALANDNLQMHWQQTDAKWVVFSQELQGVLTLSKRDFYAASSLLAQPDWSLAALEEGWVFFMPARDHVYLVPREDAFAMSHISALVKDIYKHNRHAISPYGYMFDAGKWVRYSPLKAVEPSDG
ncbi:hypothetical protein [Thaumasiovibrio subtropicus]|uniref:hypothetical protein n=1 Tax=Thaumasiovibrio subtropicus TaxID=1891207 RepID=UPI00131CBDAD|nr:hypothetical protein [Thaumasiovibrio subtropicus]